MSFNNHFYSSLSYQVARDRLQNSQVRGVRIQLAENESETVSFMLNLLQGIPPGLRYTSAHLKGTIHVTQGRNLRIEYQTRALSHRIIYWIPAIGITLTLILLGVLPSELLTIASIPAIASLLFALFWNSISDEVRKQDQYRLRDLLERMLEKQTSMATWQG